MAVAASQEPLFWHTIQFRIHKQKFKIRLCSLSHFVLLLSHYLATSHRIPAKTILLSRSVPAEFKVFRQDLQDLQDLGRVEENSWLASHSLGKGGSWLASHSLGEGGNGKNSFLELPL